MRCLAEQFERGRAMTTAEMNEEARKINADVQRDNGMAAGNSAPACSPSDLEVSQRREKMWRDECTRIVNALADLAELPRDPCPGWQPCIEKIKAIMANIPISVQEPT